MSRVNVEKKIPLSRSEKELMELIWDNSESTVLEITQLVNQRRPIARNTVRTLMERMEEKGWLTHRVQGRSYVYCAVVPREESLGQRVLDMVDKACGGNPEKLMMALLEYRGLSSEEARRIRVMLDEAKASETHESGVKTKQSKK